MKNRGYAMSAIVYPLLLICLVLVISLLLNYQNKQTILEQLKNEVQDTYNVNSGILWKTWLLKADASYNNYETLDVALSDETVANKVFNSSDAITYLKANAILVDFIKECSNYSSKLVDIILASTLLTNEEKYTLGLPCYISNGSTIYSAIGNGFSMTNKVEPSVSSNASCIAKYETLSTVGYKLTSSCKGTVSYIYSNNYINLRKYDTAHISIEYYKDCPSTTYTITNNFGFSKTKGLANNSFDANYTFTFNNASSSNTVGASDHQYLEYDLNIGSLNEDYYYKHYIMNNISTTQVCSGYNIIRGIYLY